MRILLFFGCIALVLLWATQTDLDLPDAAQQTPEPPFYAFLPAIWQGDAYPVIYDCGGAVTDEAWLAERFGAVTWTQGISGTLTAIRPCCGNCPASITVHIDRDGSPAEGVAVMLHWPDAPMLPLELRDCGLDRGVWGYTNSNGDIGFGLGPGAYYTPPGGGPHTVWAVDGPCIAGLGMIAATNHEHVDLGVSVP